MQQFFGVQSTLISIRPAVTLAITLPGPMSVTA